MMIQKQGTFQYQMVNALAPQGTVTSVGITETGSALTITNSPVTGSGNINIAGAGSSSQVILGDLSLATLPVNGVTSVALTMPSAFFSIRFSSNFNRHISRNRRWFSLPSCIRQRCSCFFRHCSWFYKDLRSSNSTVRNKCSSSYCTSKRYRTYVYLD